MFLKLFNDHTRLAIARATHDSIPLNACTLFCLAPLASTSCMSILRPILCGMDISFAPPSSPPYKGYQIDVRCFACGRVIRVLSE